MDVLTHQNDNARTGQNNGETTLTPANVSGLTKLFAHPVDGQIYVQPLVVTGVNVPGRGVRDLVLVATEQDTVYAFDASTASGASATPLWVRKLAHPSMGVTPVPYAELTVETDISPVIGITGTPVIDRASQTLFVVAKTKEVSAWIAEDVTAATGTPRSRAAGVSSWKTPNGPFTVDHVASVDVHGNLRVYFWSSQHPWEQVNVSQIAGAQVANSGLTAWQTPDGNQLVEHVAAVSPTGDLLVFYFTPQSNWRVVNVSQKTNTKVAPVGLTSWQTMNGPYNVEHVAAVDVEGHLRIFYWAPTHDWRVVDATAITGVAVAGGALTSWQTPDGPYNVEHVAAVDPGGHLRVFYWAPTHDWRQVDVTQITGVPVKASGLTSWQTPDGPYNVEHLAAVDANDHLHVFYWAPTHDWLSVDMSQITGTVVAPSGLTSWQTPDGNQLVEHVAVEAPNQDLLVFYFTPQNNWRVVDVTTTAFLGVGRGGLSSWQTPQGGKNVENVAGVTPHGELAVFSWEPGVAYRQRLHALDLGTGYNRIPSPVLIGGVVNGNGDGSDGQGHVPFSPMRHNQRSALLLLNGVVYIAWASHGDQRPYHGWVLGYDAARLQPVAAYCSTPNGIEGGIWMAGAGLAADSSGNIFCSTGNGTFDGNTNFGDTILKLSTANRALTLADYFTPYNQSTLDANDVDLGSGGVLLLPNQPGNHPHLLVSAGKEGTIYLVDRDNMGHFHAGSDSQIVQALPGAIGGVWGAPSFFNGRVYYGGHGDYLKAFQLQDGTLSNAPVAQSPQQSPSWGPKVAISANGVSNGIVWTLSDASDGHAILTAYDPDLNPLWSSDGSGATRLGTYVKFTMPTVANGKVYVGTADALTVYGL